MANINLPVWTFIPLLWDTLMYILLKTDSKTKLQSLTLDTTTLTCCWNTFYHYWILEGWKNYTLEWNTLYNISFNWNLCLLMHAAKKHSSKISNGFLNKVNWRKCQELNGVEQLKTRCIEYEVRQHKMPYGLESFQ